MNDSSTIICNSLPTNPRILVDASWYADCLNGSVPYVTANQIMEESLPKWLFSLTKNIEMIRYLVLFCIARPFDLVVLRFKLMSLVALILDAIFAKNSRFILIEFMATNRPKSKLKRILYPVFFYCILRPAVRRSMKCGHVLAEWEIDHYSDMFGVSKDRFSYIPWPLCYQDDVLPEFKTDNPVSVLSAGRASCDWETLFKAAEGQNWSLTVICRRRDLPLVDALNRNGRARVLSELPSALYQQELAAATVSVICLSDQNLSSGQVRVMDASRAGIPIVATCVKGLAGYVIHGENALLVDPGDYHGLRSAIGKLLDYPQYRRELREKAFSHAQNRTFEGYLQSIRRLVLTNLAR